jgi:hypothetical protein
MKPESCSVLALTLIAACGGVSAQTTPVQFLVGELASLPVRGITNPIFTSAVAGHLTGHALNDVVMLASNIPVLVSAPGVHRSAVGLTLPPTQPAGFVSTDVRDVAILRAAGTGGRDALLMVTGAGLWSWHMTRVGSTWVPAMAAVGGSEWAGAKRLRVADVNGDGVEDILGLMSNERSIRCLQRGASPTSWVINTNSQVRDFAVGDVVAGGNPEIVSVTGPVTGSPFTGGVRIFAPNNATALMTYSMAHTSAVCALLQDGSTRGFVVASSASPTSHHVRSFQVVSGAITLRDTEAIDAEPSAVTCGSWRVVGLNDVLVARKTHGDLIEVQHTGGFLLGTVRTVVIGGTASTNNRSVPMLVDLQGDPTASSDLRCQPMLLVGRSGGSIAVQQRLSWLDTRFPRPIAGFAQNIQPPPGSSGGLAPTHVELDRWALGDSPANPAFVNQDATRIWAPVQLINGVYRAVLPSAGWQAQPAWTCAVRFVHAQVDGNGVVTAVLKRWPARNWNMTITGAQQAAWLAAFTEAYGGATAQPEDLPLSFQPPGSFGPAGDIVPPPPGPGASNQPPKPGG